MQVKGIYVVYANWCPHCVPTTVEPLKKIAHEVGVQLHLYDIDTEDVVKADEIVKKYGDWTPDYIIPQVFVEHSDGKIEHVLTGDRRGVIFTKKAVDDLVRSDLFESPMRAS